MFLFEILNSFQQRSVKTNRQPGHSALLSGCQATEALLGYVTGRRSWVTNKGSYLRLKLDHSQGTTDRERIKLSLSKKKKKSEPPGRVMQRGGNTGVMQTDASPSLISLRCVWIMNEAPCILSMQERKGGLRLHSLLSIYCLFSLKLFSLNSASAGSEESPKASHTHTQKNWAAVVRCFCPTGVKHLQIICKCTRQ